jgi:hypothetical protein
LKPSLKLAAALVAFAVIGTAIGVVASLPYQFGGIGDPARVSEDFVGKGTAVSPPLVALVILVIGGAIAAQRGLVGRVGSGLLALLAAVFLVATIGEILGAGAFSGTAQVFVVLWNLIGAAIIFGMLAFSAREALGRR